jgi:hypothetical protein
VGIARGLAAAQLRNRPSQRNIVGRFPSINRNYYAGPAAILSELGIKLTGLLPTQHVEQFMVSHHQQ